MELLVVLSSTLFVTENVFAKHSAAGEKLTNEGTIEDLPKDASEGRLDTGDILQFVSQGFQSIKGGGIDVGGKGISKPLESTIRVSEVAVSDLGGTA